MAGVCDIIFCEIFIEFAGYIVDLRDKGMIGEFRSGESGEKGNRMSKLLRVVNREQCIGCFSCMFACSRTWFGCITVEKAALRVKNYAGAEGLFSIRACYGCVDPDCARACQTQALTKRTAGGVDFDAAKCNHCGDCVHACAPKALQWDQEKKIPLVCHHCSACVQFCPNKVLDMADVAQ